MRFDEKKYVCEFRESFEKYTLNR